MGKTSCIEHPGRVPYLILRKDYIEICHESKHSHCAAAILHLFEFWTNGALANDADTWLGKPKRILHEALLGLFGESVIDAALKFLLDHNFIARRENPNGGWDRTLQYRFNVEGVQAAIKEWCKTNAPYLEIKDSIAQNHGMDALDSSNASLKSKDSSLYKKEGQETEEGKEEKTFPLAKEASGDAPPPEPATIEPQVPPEPAPVVQPEVPFDGGDHPDIEGAPESKPVTMAEVADIGYDTSAPIPEQVQLFRDSLEDVAEVVKEKKPRARSENQQRLDAMVEALKAAFNYIAPTKSDYSYLRGVAKQLVDVEFPPGEVQGLVNYVRAIAQREQWTGRVSPTSIVTKGRVSDYLNACAKRKAQAAYQDRPIPDSWRPTVNDGVIPFPAKRNPTGTEGKF